MVSVTGDVKHHGLETAVRSEIYVPHLQEAPSAYLTVAIATTGDPLALIGGARAEVRALDKDLSVFNVRSLEQLLDDRVAERRFSMLLAAVFTSTALVLAAPGIYGVTAHSVSRRTHEIGVRMACGARPADVLALVLSQGMRLFATGTILGLVSSLALARVLSSMLFRVTAADTLILRCHPARPRFRLPAGQLGPGTQVDEGRSGRRTALRVIRDRLNGHETSHFGWPGGRVRCAATSVIGSSPGLSTGLPHGPKIRYNGGVLITVFFTEEVPWPGPAEQPS